MLIKYYSTAVVYWEIGDEANRAVNEGLIRAETDNTISKEGLIVLIDL